jgi:hypothetical protein
VDEIYITEIICTVWIKVMMIFHYQYLDHSEYPKSNLGATSHQKKIKQQLQGFYFDVA